LSVQDAGIGGSLQVSWASNPESDIQAYTLSYGNQSGDYPLSVNAAAGATSLLLSGLSDGIRYYMVLSATNTSGHESAASTEVSAVPLLVQGIAPPMAISDLSLSTLGQDLGLSWSRPTIDIYGRPTTVVGYEVHRSPSPGFIPSLATRIASIGDGGTTSFIDPGEAVSPGTSYYLVVAFDISGHMSGAGRELPNGISDLSLTMPAADVVGLSWSAVTTDLQGLPTLIDHYQVHVTDTPTGRGSLDQTTLWLDNVTDLSIQLTLPATPRYISVLAVDNRGNPSPY
jgi:hypothetical protein